MKNIAWIAKDLQEQYDLILEYAEIPMERRLAWLAEKVNKDKILILGTTELSAPELATECIKKGVMAKSLVQKGKKNELHKADKND